MTQTIIWQPHPGPQTEALTRTEFEILYGGARGGGKTDAGIAWLLRHIDNSLYRALIIRKNSKDLSDWVDRAKRMYRGTGAEFVGSPPEIRFPSGALFKTGHLNNDDAYTAYQGHEYQRMLIEELTQIRVEENYLKLISSCRSTVKGIFPQVFNTTNPGGIGHGWVKARFVDPAAAGASFTDMVTGKPRIFIPAKVTDNPTLMQADPTYIDFLEGLPEQLRKAWKEGNWNIVAGQVFTEWNTDLHVVQPFEIPGDWKRWLAMDWGVNKPFSVGWYAQDFDGRTYLYRELYMDGTKFESTFGVSLIPSRLAKVIINLMKTKKEEYLYLVADPSMWNKPDGGESIAERMMKEGLKMIPADNDRINGLARYREALAIAPDKKPWYQIFSTCVDTIRTIPNLPYDLRKVEDVDTDAEDHCYDRDRYFFMSRPYRPTMPEPAVAENSVQALYDKLVKQRNNNNNDDEWNDWSA